MTTTARDARWNAKVREQRRAQARRRSARLTAHARLRHAELVTRLGGVCEWCEERGETAPLSIDHIDGITWTHRKLNLHDRVKRYWAEYVAGVRLRVLCVPCNSRRGRPEAELDPAPF